MAYSAEVRRDERIAKIEAEVFGATLLHVRTTIEVYRRHEETQLPEHIASRPDLDLLIDPSDGYRLLRSDTEDTDAWDELAADAKLIHIPITCHQKQVPIILNTTSRVIGVISGARAGKTHSLAYWMLRQWMLKGDSEALFWWVAPDWSQTEIGVTKLCRGDGERTAPVFPSELVRYFPKDKNQARQYMELVDGSQIAFKQAGGKGDNLRGYAPRAIGVDEGTAIRHRENWQVMLGRCSTHDASIFTATTPVAGHWLRADVIVRSAHVDTVTHYEISIFDNPWEHPDIIEELIEAAGGKDDPVVRREYYGEWLPSSAALWPDWDPGKHLVLDRDIWSIEDLRDAGFIPKHYVDVTARMAAGYWKGCRNAEVLIGQDFNVWPMASAIARGFGDPSDQETWGLFFFNEVLTRGNVHRHCEVLSEKYPGAPVSVDATGALRGTHPSQGAKGSSTNRLEMQRAGFHAKACNRYKGKPVAPRVIDSVNLVHRLQRQGRLFFHGRARKTCEALDNQEREMDGSIMKIRKTAGNADDRLSAPTDAMRYLVWPLFMSELKNKVGKYYDNAPRDF